MKKAKPRTFDSMRAAAAGMGVPLSEIRRAKAGGCIGFRSNRIYEAEVHSWLSANPLAQAVIDADPKIAKTLEEVRKLRLANDAKQGRLIERAWVAAKIQGMAGEIHAFRSKSEASHPTRFAAAAGDVAACRIIVREIWDEILRDLNSLEKHFAE